MLGALLSRLKEQLILFLLLGERLLATQGLQAFEAHALKVFLLEATRLLDVHPLRVKVKVREHGPVVREGAVLYTPEQPLL